MATAIQPRLGPAQVTPETFANQAFRSTADRLARLPAQWRGAVALGRLTVEGAIAAIGDGPCTLDPHDAFLAFSGQDFAR